MAQVIKFRVTHHRDEGACDECGGPIYVGDTAWLFEGPGGVLCTRECLDIYGKALGLPQLLAWEKSTGKECF